MRYLVLACDYDGTLAYHGAVDDTTLASLERLRASGRRLLLVTGRALDDLKRVFPAIHLFDRIVAENGGVLYDPGARDVQPLALPPPADFVRELERRGVTPLSVGQVIVATWEPHDPVVFQVIHQMGLELQVVFNKGAVMVLPSGVNKATGLRRALELLKLSPHNTVGVGDAENDHTFLAACECGVAVSNALDSVKSRVDLVTNADHGAGVVELIDRMIASDLDDLDPPLARHHLLIGEDETGSSIRLPPHDGVLLIAGPSGAGKTTVTTTLLEALCDDGYQFCVIDPEGDYHEFADAIALHGGDGRALVDETLRVLDRPAENVIVSLFDLRLDERPQFLQQLLPRLLELRAATARPHWIVIDEAHHLLPASWQQSGTMLPGQLVNTVLVTVHPDHMAPSALDLVETVIVVGPDPQATVDAFMRARRAEPLELPPALDDRQLAWLLQGRSEVRRFRVVEPKVDRRRHKRKYAQGELGDDKSFYFRGPEGRLNLRAQNLELFTQIADGVDDDTWQYHVRQGDLSRWFRTAIKDEELAAEAAEIEAREDLSARQSRVLIRHAIERRYTSPA
jgi:hydroxymethylpyrimidine pyrophosphatase-like HAD family hydrolase